VLSTVETLKARCREPATPPPAVIVVQETMPEDRDIVLLLPWRRRIPAVTHVGIPSQDPRFVGRLEFNLDLRTETRKSAKTRNESTRREGWLNGQS
jgi:hypothetical protein